MPIRNAKRGIIFQEDLKCMALIICSECGKSYSNKADSCTSCGCPTNLQPQESSQSQNTLDTLAKQASSRLNEIESMLTDVEKTNTKNTASLAHNKKPHLQPLTKRLDTKTLIKTKSSTSSSNSKSLIFCGVISIIAGAIFAANAFPILGILIAAGGATFLSIGKDSLNSRPSASQNKSYLYHKLIHLVYNDPSIRGTPSLYASELNNEELVINTHRGRRICSFAKISKSSSDSLECWELKI